MSKMLILAVTNVNMLYMLDTLLCYESLAPPHPLSFICIFAKFIYNVCTLHRPGLNYANSVVGQLLVVYLGVGYKH